MSKTEENYIGITEKADDIFGKTMSIPDEIMMKWFDLLSLRPLEEIKKVSQQSKAKLTAPCKINRPVQN